jgi:hypothetical protein
VYVDTIANRILPTAEEVQASSLAIDLAGHVHVGQLADWPDDEAGWVLTSLGEAEQVVHTPVPGRPTSLAAVGGRIWGIFLQEGERSIRGFPNPLEDHHASCEYDE